MKKALITLLALASLAGSANADLIFGGDFQLYKPGTDPKYTIFGELDDPGPFTSYAQGVGDGVSIAGSGIVNFSDETSGDTADLPGWVIVNGTNPDTGKNGIEGSAGLNIFAGWGGQQRIETDAPVATVEANRTYTISAMVDGPAGGPIEGTLAFHLVAGGVQLVPSSVVDVELPGGSGFQTISRTYDSTSYADHIGADLTIILGVEDDNANDNRMIWDDISLDGTGPPPFAITEIIYSPGDEMVSLTWDSSPGETFTIRYSTDLGGWEADIDDGIPADPGETTTFSFDVSGLASDGGELFFRVEK